MTDAEARTRAHELMGTDVDGDCYAAHGRDGQGMCNDVTAELRRHATEVAELRAEVERLCAEAVAERKARDELAGAALRHRADLQTELKSAEAAHAAHHDHENAEIKRLGGMAEQLQVQLSGCSVAALGGTSEPQVATREMYGWSRSYQDVLDLRLRFEAALADVARLTKERDEAVKEGRRDVLQFLREQANLVPLGAEDTRRGSSVYNWHLDAISRVAHWLGSIEDRALTPSIPGSGGRVVPHGQEARRKQVHRRANGVPPMSPNAFDSSTGETRSWPEARADGAPSVCLRCTRRPAAPGPTAVWCLRCADSLATKEWFACRDAWRAHRASLAAPPTTDARDELLERAEKLLRETPSPGAFATWLADYRALRGGR